MTNCIFTQLKCISVVSTKGTVKSIYSQGKSSSDQLIIKTLSDLHFYRLMTIWTGN